ncbi:MAG: hypothetical protein K2Q03_02305 [Sphingobacteriaceae bacterium]|nr:hypothetical protein [Sphingobacteriaceae bacterium]
MFKEYETEQKNILSYVEQRLDEIQAVEILDLKTAYDMIEECDYLNNYLCSIFEISAEVKKLTKTILRNSKILQIGLLKQQKHLEQDNKF